MSALSESHLRDLPTEALREIKSSLSGLLEDDDGLLGWFGKKWARVRLRRVQEVLRQREWARKEWS